MGFWSKKTKNTPDPAREQKVEAPPANFPELFTGILLTVSIQEGKPLLAGRLTAFTHEDLTIERTPGQLSFDTCSLGTTAYVRGTASGSNVPFDLKGNVAESTRVVCRIKNLKVVPHDEQRANFRLPIGTDVSLYYQDDERFQNPEKCKLVNISIGGACIESEYIHTEGEVLRLRVQIEEYTPMVFLGQVIRVEENPPGKFRYGFLFAQLDDQEATALTRVLFNVQVGNKKSWSRSSNPGYWH